MQVLTRRASCGISTKRDSPSDPPLLPPHELQPGLCLDKPAFCLTQLYCHHMGLKTVVTSLGPASFLFGFDVHVRGDTLMLFYSATKRLKREAYEGNQFFCFEVINMNAAKLLGMILVDR